MSRSTPDPVFAAAAREEVQRRVREAADPATARRARRPWAMELGAIAGVAVLIAGVAVGVGALRPVFDAGTVPAGIATRTAPPTEAPSVTPTQEAPTAPPTSIAPPASEAPTEAPTSPPNSIPTPTPTADPTTAPPVTSTALIGPAGAKERTSAEIRTWALSLGYGEIWAEQEVLDASCMADHGYRYDPELARSGGSAAQHVGLTDAQYTDFQDALWGPQTDLPYTWQTAGCHGRSVHLTGQDDNN